MKRTSLLLFFLIFQLSYLQAQDRFSISGYTRLVSTGKATLWKIASGELYSINADVDTVKVNDHRFKLEGTIEYPEQFRLFFMSKDEQYVTEPFFIDTGFQEISVGSMSSTYDIKFSGLQTTTERSSTNREFKNEYLPLFDAINKRIKYFLSQIEGCDHIKDGAEKEKCILQLEKERLTIRAMRDSVLLSYSIRNPKSPIIPSQLSQSIWDYGYNDYYQKIFDQISIYTRPRTVKFLETFLNKQKSKVVGNFFPLVDFVNAYTSQNYIQKNKYTLIEFWYSACSPCIRQFNSLRPIYERYRERGFDIAAISIDDKESIADYKSVLKKQSYPWSQILDTAGVRTNSMDINKFPTSFLLDSNGKIINADIKPEILDEFLRKNLKL